ncbi:MAG: hypothetical protein AB7F74_17145 [Parvibaculaceae bacterium]
MQSKTPGSRQKGTQPVAIPVRGAETQNRFYPEIYEKLQRLSNKFPRVESYYAIYIIAEDFNLYGQMRYPVEDDAFSS